MLRFMLPRATSRCRVSAHQRPTRPFSTHAQTARTARRSTLGFLNQWTCLDCTFQLLNLVLFFCCCCSVSVSVLCCGLCDVFRSVVPVGLGCAAAITGALATYWLSSSQPHAALADTNNDNAPPAAQQPAAAPANASLPSAYSAPFAPGLSFCCVINGFICALRRPFVVRSFLFECVCYRKLDQLTTWSAVCARFRPEETCYCFHCKDLTR